MILFGIIIGVFAAYTLLTLYTRRVTYRGNLARALANFGLPPQDTDYDLESIRSYTNSKPSGATPVDAITWDDLDMDNVYKRMNTCLSSVGEEYLYDLLHHIPLGETGESGLEKTIAFFEENPQAMEAAQKALLALGKSNHHGLCPYLFSPERNQLPHGMLYKVMGRVPIVGLFLIPLSMQLGVVTLIVSFFVNLYLHFRVANQIATEVSAINYFCKIVRCGKRLYKHCHIEALGEGSKVFRKIAPPQGAVTQHDMTGITMYMNILLLLDVRHFIRFTQEMKGRREAAHRMYKALGEMDAAIAVMSFRKSLPFYCTPRFGKGNAMDFQDIYHPLIQEPVANSGAFDRHVLITGSNASGKSSFIKALAINGILAQTIHTAMAREFTMGQSLIVSSMAIRDNLLGGDSYFVAEVRSIKRIFDLLTRYPCTCFIDEILKGTNTVERIAASAATLNHLVGKNCLCVVATHDIELTHMLPYENYHFKETIIGDDVVFDYTLRPGPSQTRNAIKLLSVFGFDPAVVAAAESIAREKSMSI